MNRCHTLRNVTRITRTILVRHTPRYPAPSILPSPLVPATVTRQPSFLTRLVQMSDLTPTSAEIVASITAPQETLKIQGPKSIWRAHAKSSFVPPTATTAPDPSSSSSAITPAAPRYIPPVSIDESQFIESVTCVALKIQAKQCGKFQSHFRTPVRSKLLYTRARISNIADGPTKEEKYTLLAAKTLEELAEYPKDTLEFMKGEGAQAQLMTFQLDYDYFSLDHILRALLPESMHVPAGFETVGHIAHLNLSDEQRPYGAIIARVILDKNPNIHTVVNKLGAIASEYRVFNMEVLAGLDSFQAEVKEHNCVFKFDFSKVYWNSRLSTEHSRLIDLFRPRELIVDAMCGIGPFVVPGAKKLGFQKNFLSGQPAILANDLNPDSFSSLQANLDLNKVGSLVSCHNMDGRLFLWDVLRSKQLAPNGVYRGVRAAHVLMNLPAIAIEFLDSFVGLYADGVDGDTADPAILKQLRDSPPLVHVYCFSRSVNDPLSDLVPRVEAALGGRKIPQAVLVKEPNAIQQQGKKGAGKAKQHKQQQQQKDKKDSQSMDVDEVNGSDASPSAASSSTAASSSSAPGVPPLDRTFIRFVRNVAPSKDMFCVSFHIPTEVLAARPTWREMQSTAAAAASSSSGSPAAASPSSSATVEDASMLPAGDVSLKRKLEEAEDDPDTAHQSKKSK